MFTKILLWLLGCNLSPILGFCKGIIQSYNKQKGNKVSRKSVHVSFKNQPIRNHIYATSSVNFSKRIGVYFDRLLIFSPPNTRTFLQTRLSSHLPFLLPSLIVIYSPIKSLTIDQFDYLIQYHNLYFGFKYNFPVLKLSRMFYKETFYLICSKKIYNLTLFLFVCGFQSMQLARKWLSNSISWPFPCLYGKKMHCSFWWCINSSLPSLTRTLNWLCRYNMIWSWVLT